MDIDAWSCELTAQIHIDSFAPALTPAPAPAPAPAAGASTPSHPLHVATETKKAEEESGDPPLFDEHIRKDGETDAKESQSSEEDENEESEK